MASAGRGNIPILGDVGESDKDSQLLLDDIKGTDAFKLMSLFKKELKESETKHMITVVQIANPPTIKIIGKESERRVAKAVKERWLDLLKTLHHDVISGNTMKTLTNVEEIIQRHTLEDRVIPIQCIPPHEKKVRIFSKKESCIEMVKHAFDDPDPWAENVSTTPFPKVLTNSQRRRQKDNNVASFPSFDADTTLKFVTNEGLVVKVYKKPITRLNVDAIVNAANDMLGNYGGVADVISKAAGYEMEKECKEIVRNYGKLRDAENEVTRAGNLPYKGIIHAVGPRWSDYRSKSECLNVLVKTVTKVLESAKRKQFSTVAMPPISSGIFAVPKLMCAAMYLKGIFEFSKQGYLDSPKEFHIIDIHDEVLDMIKEWYTKYKKDPTCIEVSAVLKSSDSDHRSPLNRPPAWQHDERGNKRKSDNFSESQRRAGHVGKEVMQARAADPGPTTIKVVTKFCGKTDILIYTGNVLQLKGIDVVVVSEDGLMKGEGGLSMALLNAGCDRYKKEHKKLKPWILEHKQKTVLLTSGGDKLPFRHVLHAILRRQIAEQEQVFQRKLQTTIDNVLLQTNLLNIKSKKGITIVLPMIGLGSKPTEDVVKKCCWSVKQTIEKFLKTIPKVRIDEIHLVNYHDNVTEILQKYFDQQKPHIKQHPRPLQRPNSRTGDRDKYTPLKSLTKNDTWRMDAKANKRQDVSQYMSTYMKKQKQKGNLNILNDEAQEDDDLTCVVCLCEMDDPVELKECKHVFCRECIMEVFAAKPSCPVCGAVYGNIYGDQPRDGCATVYIDEEALPGYLGKKTWVISYDFPDGKQEAFHPEPGKPYDGLKRRAFLPYNKEGTEVLNLLKRAFQQGLTFTIGTSRTSGKEGVITWNDIHHKTSKTGGPQKFGYPDPEYLTRVKDELASKGVSSDC